MQTTASPPLPTKVFTKQIGVEGRLVTANCIDIDGQTYTLGEGLLRIARLDDEWYADVANPALIISGLRADSSFRPDIFTFWQRLPDTQPRYHFPIEWESVAALRISTFANWWEKQISCKTRNMIRKSEKQGVEVKETDYDDEFVRGMTDIFNETPVRQGRPFWHYGKDFETVKREFARFTYRERMIGAYFRGEMIGFMMLGDAGQYALTGQIISKFKHRDKGTNNALIANAVELCERKRWPYLVYALWGDTSLTEFKRHSGFQEVRLPRYFVPLTAKGNIALRLGLHRNWKDALPGRIKAPLKRLRTSLVQLRKR